MGTYSLRKIWAGWLGTSHDLYIQCYRGFASESELHLIGTLFEKGPQKSPHGAFFKSIRVLISSFWVKTSSNKIIRLRVGEETFETKTDRNGFYSLVVPHHPQTGGWHESMAQVLDEKGKILLEQRGEYIMNTPSGYACISDIDDTFLVSHSSSALKKFWLLVTRSVRRRKPFEGVVKHYQALGEGIYPQNEEKQNPFFYVSSSEWNLYRFLTDFMDFYKLPKGVLLLNELKQLKDIFLSGSNKHGGKFVRIVRILKAYPGQMFVLLGDDTQQDPYIYQKVATHFPAQIRAIYIRQVNHLPKPEVQKVFDEWKKNSITACYFNHSHVAIDHSRQYGLIR